MSKDKQEYICLENLRNKSCGKYVGRVLRNIRAANVIETWSERPDFLLELEEKVIGIEHFTIDQIYIENRSASRVVNERVMDVYHTHHEALEKELFDAKLACDDIEKEIQFAVNQTACFDYDICMNQFERVFKNHVNKVPFYWENMSEYPVKELYFLIELSSILIDKYNNLIRCYAIRKDGGGVLISGHRPIITDRMLEIIKNQIGKINGVIIQSYSFLDLKSEMKSMLYLDLTSEHALQESIEEQNIEVYKEYFINTEKINLRLNLAH